MRKRTKSGFKRVVPIILVALLGVIVWVSVWFYGEYDYRFGDAVTKSGAVKIMPNLSLNEAAAMLEKEGYINSADEYIRIAKKFDRGSIRVGNYKFDKGESYRTLQNRLYFGNQTPIRVTFNNIRTLDRLAGALTRNLLVDSLTMLNHLKGEAKTNGQNIYIARFIPNTYEFYWTVTPSELTEKLEKESQKFWNANSRKEKAQKLGYTPEQISTIASIVYEETKVEAEMDKVAGVYINRLRVGMPLQADPTVKFAVGDFSIKRVLNRHLEYDSPYNTYKYKGLPPGPICVPPISAIDATLSYQDKQHSYLYFCANPDFSGTHAFAKTLSEHNQNAAAYHRELNRRKIR